MVLPSGLIELIIPSNFMHKGRMSYVKHFVGICASDADVPTTAAASGGGAAVATAAATCGCGSVELVCQSIINSSMLCTGEESCQ